MTQRQGTLASGAPPTYLFYLLLSCVKASGR